MKVFKRIKKVMVATLIAAMTLGSVTGCSSSSNGSSNGGGDSKTLNFIVYDALYLCILRLLKKSVVLRILLNF